jgi:hypothetical protein
MTKFLGCQISDELDVAIAKRIAETKESKTQIATIALEKELGLQTNQTLSDRVTTLEQKVSDIEARLDSDRDYDVEQKYKQ